MKTTTYPSEISRLAVLLKLNEGTTFDRSVKAGLILNDGSITKLGQFFFSKEDVVGLMEFLYSTITREIRSVVDLFIEFESVVDQVGNYQDRNTLESLIKPRLDRKKVRSIAIKSLVTALSYSSKVTFALYDDQLLVSVIKRGQKKEIPDLVTVLLKIGYISYKKEGNVAYLKKDPKFQVLKQGRRISYVLFFDNSEPAIFALANNDLELNVLRLANRLMFITKSMVEKRLNVSGDQASYAIKTLKNKGALKLIGGPRRKDSRYIISSKRPN